MAIIERRILAYVASHCRGCEATYALAGRIGATRPGWRLEIVDIDAAGALIPDDVFGTPTYAWNGRTVFLGNPGEAELLALIDRIEAA